MGRPRTSVADLRGFAFRIASVDGIELSARQIQRLVQSVGPGAQSWQEREALAPLPGTQRASIMYVSGDASGVPMRQEELEGRAGKGPDGKAKTRMALGSTITPG